MSCPCVWVQVAVRDLQLVDRTQVELLREGEAEKQVSAATEASPCRKVKAPEGRLLAPFRKLWVWLTAHI